MRAMGSLSGLLEEISEFLERLSEEARAGMPILVEGQSDVRALEELGVKGKIIALKTDGKRLVDVVERIERSPSEEIIILTDFDRAGRELASSLAAELEGMGLRANLSYWRWLRTLVSSFTKDIEGLPSLVETLMRKAGLRARARWCERAGGGIDSCSIASEV